MRSHAFIETDRAHSRHRVARGVTGIRMLPDDGIGLALPIRITEDEIDRLI